MNQLLDPEILCSTIPMQNVGRHPRPHDFFNAHSNSLKLKSAARASATENDSMYSQRTYQEYHSCSGAILLGSASSFDVHPAMSTREAFPKFGKLIFLCIQRINRYLLQINIRSNGIDD